MYCLFSHFPARMRGHKGIARGGGWSHQSEGPLSPEINRHTSVYGECEIEPPSDISEPLCCQLILSLVTPWEGSKMAKKYENKCSANIYTLTVM